jgi:hypothetical protein
LRLRARLAAIAAAERAAALIDMARLLLHRDPQRAV